jgi:hypothetical protein
VLVTAPGIGWINAYTIASEIGDISRFASPAALCGYTGLFPRVRQSGGVDARGPISKHVEWAPSDGHLMARVAWPRKDVSVDAENAPCVPR